MTWLTTQFLEHPLAVTSIKKPLEAKIPNFSSVEMIGKFSPAVSTVVTVMMKADFCGEKIQSKLGVIINAKFSRTSLVDFGDYDKSHRLPFCVCKFISVHIAIHRSRFQYFINHHKLIIIIQLWSAGLPRWTSYYMLDSILNWDLQIESCTSMS